MNDATFWGQRQWVMSDWDSEVKFDAYENYDTFSYESIGEDVESEEGKDDEQTKSYFELNVSILD